MKMDATENEATSSGTSLVTIPPRPLPPLEASWHDGPPPPPEILTAGMDPVWLWHSLRRRWPLAVALGLGVAVVATLLAWYFIPDKSQALAVLKVDAVKPIVFKRVDEGESDFETYQRTLAGMFKTEPVLSAALAMNDGQLGKLPTLSSIPPLERTSWLADELVVEFPDKAELTQVSLKGGYPDDLKIIVNSVTKAFLQEIIYKEKQQRLQNRDTLHRSYANTKSEIRDKTKAYYALSRELSSLTPDDNANDRSLAYKAHRSMAAADVEYLREEIEAIKKQLFEISVAQTLRKAQRNDPEFMQAAIDKLIAEDPQVQLYRQQLTATDFLLGEEISHSKRSEAPSIQRYRQQRESLARRLAQREAELRPQLQAQLELTPNFEDLAQAKSDEVRKAALEARLAELVAKHSDKVTEMKRLEERSLELDVMAAELEQLQTLARDMNSKIETLQVEIDLPDRVREVQAAEIRPGMNRLQRGVLISMAGLLGFGLTGLGIAVWQFQARRIYGPQQLEHGLGIRVLGELPPLAGRSSLDEAEPSVVMLLESIDSLRTTLIHLGGAEGLKVVMVTSARSGEGRTTVASQLAASLARAGKKTVIVDADVRHPSLHRLFDLPVVDGLCELLRGEIELERAVRPTGVRGLSAMAAGVFDGESLEALSQDQMRPIVNWLREDFDYVILDAAPVLSLADALIVGQYSDGAILSVMRDETQAAKLHAASERLHGVGVRVLGAVVNGMPLEPHARAMRLGLSRALEPASASEAIDVE